MIERKTFSVEGNCQINVTTEQMGDGTWAVVTSVTHRSETSEQVTDLPVPTERFAAKTDAEEYGLRLGREWLAQNRPHAA